MIQLPIRSMLFNFHVLIQFQKFLLVLVSSFILLLSKKILDIIFTLLSVLSFVLWLNVVCLGECFMYWWENVYAVTVGWNILSVPIRSTWSIMQIRPNVSLLILSTWSVQCWIGVLMFSTIIVLGSIFLFSYSNI